MSIELVMPSNHLILCCPLLRLPAIFPSVRVFSNELAARIRWPKYWSFSFSISHSNEYSRLISLRIDWFDLLAGIFSLTKTGTPQWADISSFLYCRLDQLFWTFHWVLGTLKRVCVGGWGRESLAIFPFSSALPSGSISMT